MNLIIKPLKSLYNEYLTLRGMKMAENESSGTLSTVGTILKLIFFLVTFIFTVLVGAILLFYNLYQQEREENERLKTASAGTKEGGS